MENSRYLKHSVCLTDSYFTDYYTNCNNYPGTQCTFTLDVSRWFDRRISSIPCTNDVGFEMTLRRS